MITILKKVAISTFGNGTTRISNLCNKRVGVLQLRTCKKSKIGNDAGPAIASSQIDLIFRNIESLDVLMEKLQDTKELMLEAIQNEAAR